jgi:hypothetical protein
MSSARSSEQDAFDAQVMQAIRAGNIRLATIAATVDREDRAVDRALQRLRKAGKIEYASEPGWHIPSKPKRPATMGEKLARAFDD